MLKSHDIEFDYREYRKDPLSAEELRSVMRRLGVSPREVLRKNDRAARQNGVTGDEPDEELIGLMAEHPTLLQRPIGVLGDRAVVGRPPENLLTLASD